MWYVGYSWPGIKPMSPKWKCGDLTTELPGKSHHLVLRLTNVYSRSYSIDQALVSSHVLSLVLYFQQVKIQGP